MGKLNVKRVESLTCPLCKAELDGAEMRPFETVACPECGGAIEVPAAFGPYVLNSIVRQDDFSAAFRAFDTVLERQVALRIIIDTEDEARFEQVQDQIRKLAALSNEYVAAFYKVGRDEEQFYFETELLTGGTLRELLARSGQLDIDEALGVVRDVASGLAACHEHGLQHGAIGLDRLWLDQNGHVKIADFIGDRLRRRKGVISDLQTAAPELIAAARKNEADTCLSVALDIYALGVVLSQLVTGKPPYPEALKACVDAKQESLPKISGQGSKLSSLIRKMTAPDPVDRPHAMADVIDLIDQLLLGPQAPEADDTRLAELASEVSEVNEPKRASSSQGALMKAASETHLEHEAALSNVMQADLSSISEEAWIIENDLASKGYPKRQSPAIDASSRTMRDSLGVPQRPEKKNTSVVQLTAGFIVGFVAFLLLLIWLNRPAHLSLNPESSIAVVPEKRDEPESAPELQKPEPEKNEVIKIAPDKSVTPIKAVEVAPVVHEQILKIPDDEPIGHWTMKRAEDISRNRLATKAIGTPQFTNDNDGWHMSLSDGKGGMHAEAPPQLRPTVPFSLVMWLTPEKQEADTSLIAWGDQAKDESGFSVKVSKDNVARIGFGGKSRFVNLDLTPYQNKLTSLIVVVDSRVYRMSVYVNGEEWIASPFSGHFNFDLKKGLAIGSAPDEKAFKGKIGEVRLYGNALDSGQIQQLSRLSSKNREKLRGGFVSKGAIHRWRFDQDVHDELGGIKSSIAGQAKIVKDEQRGKVLELDGNGSYLKLSKGFTDFSKGITMSAWIRPTDNRGNARIFELSNQRWLQNIGFGLSPDAMGFVVFKDLSTARNPEPNILNAHGVHQLNQWQHVAAVLDANKRATLYHEGVKVIEKTLPLMPPVKVRSQNYIGITSWSLVYKRLNEAFTGRLDDLIIYGRPLDPDEIAVLSGGKSAIELPAEEAVLSNAVLMDEDPQYSGKGYLQFNAEVEQAALKAAQAPPALKAESAPPASEESQSLETGAKVHWTFEGATPGRYQLLIRYARASEDQQEASLILRHRGERIQTLAFPFTGNLEHTWMTIATELDLKGIKQRISLVAKSGEIAPKIDFLTLRLIEAAAPPVGPPKPISKASAQVASVDGKKEQKQVVPEVVTSSVPQGPYFVDKHMVVSAESGVSVAVNQQGHAVVAEPIRKAETYTCELKLGGKVVTGLRLSLLPHEQLKTGGPGIGPRGAFAISDMTISAAPKDNPDQAVPVEVGDLSDDENQSGLRTQSLFDGKSFTRWGGKNRPGLPRVITIPFKTPYKSESGIVLKITMSTATSMNFKAFRLAYTASEDPLVLKTPAFVPPPSTYRRHLNLGYKTPVTVKDETWTPAVPYKAGGDGYEGGKFIQTKGNPEKWIEQGVILDKTCLQGVRALRFTAPRGNRYKVTLYFQENWTSKKKLRVFDVAIEGKQVIKGLDLNTSPGRHKTLTKNFDIDLRDGVIDITFTKQGEAPPIINAVKVQNLGSLKWSAADLKSFAGQ